jgi:hypothetical protein
MAESLVRGAAPPAPHKTLEVFRVTSAESSMFVCCCGSIYGQWVHWFGRRSHECSQDKGNCEGCRNNWPCKWKGYLHVCSGSLMSEGFLEVTATCWALLLQQLPDRQNLRGVRFRLSRTKGGARGRYLVEVLEAKADLGKLPEERDPYPVLRKLWSAKKGPSHLS